MTWIRNYIHSFLWGVIAHTCPNFSGGLNKLPLKYNIISMFYVDVISDAGEKRTLFADRNHVSWVVWIDTLQSHRGRRYGCTLCVALGLPHSRHATLSMGMSLDIRQPFWGYCPGTVSWASYQIRKIAGCACAGNAGNVFPRRRFQRKPLVSDPGMHHGTCVPHVPRCMSGSLTCGDGENVPGIPGACVPAILRIWQEAHVIKSLQLIWRSGNPRF